MSDIDQNIQFQAEMASINSVTSEDLVRNAKNSGDLQLFQERLDDAQDRVEVVKDVLLQLEPYDLNPQIAQTMDRQLDRSASVLDRQDAAKELELLTGAESLGLTLMPRDYLKTRLAGCESFLGDFMDLTRKVTQHLGISFHEAYTLFMETHDNLESQITLLEDSLSSLLPTSGDGAVVLGSRLFNLFKVNGKVDEDWTGNLNKLVRTITAINGNYLLSSKNSMNQILSYFGNFAGATEEKGLERYLGLPLSVPMDRFRECSYPCKEKTTVTLNAKQSVELMGGAYFYDVAPVEKVMASSNTDEVQNFLDRQYYQSTVGFEKSSEMVFPKLDNEVKALTAKEMKAIVTLLRQVLKEWRKAFEGTDKYKLLETDFKDVAKGILESDMSDTLKKEVQMSFSSIVRFQQNELLTLRNAVNKYLVLIVNGLMELSYMSIKANQEE
jgi:hypothetical protein